MEQHTTTALLINNGNSVELLLLQRLPSGVQRVVTQCSVECLTVEEHLNLIFLLLLLLDSLHSTRSCCNNDSSGNGQN